MNRGLRLKVYNDYWERPWVYMAKIQYDAGNRRIKDKDARSHQSKQDLRVNKFPLVSNRLRRSHRNNEYRQHVLSLVQLEAVWRKMLLDLCKEEFDILYKYDYICTALKKSLYNLYKIICIYI